MWCHLTITEEGGFATDSRQVREDDGPTVALIAAEHLVFGSWTDVQDQYEWPSLYRCQWQRLVKRCILPGYRFNLHILWKLY
jgi:hypothetical protein